MNGMNCLIALRLVLCLFLAGPALAQIPVTTATPYVEDFETGPAGWTPAGPAAALWQLGTPSSPSSPPPSGVNAWTTNLTGNYTNNSIASVVSPPFDCSGLAADPVFAFELNFATENFFDWVRVEIDLGSGFSQLGSASDPNWYNSGSVGGGGSGWTGTPETGFIHYTHALDGAAGNPNVVLQVLFRSDGSVTFPGAAFDDVSIASNDWRCPGTDVLGGDDIDQTVTIGSTLAPGFLHGLSVGQIVTIVTSSPGGTLNGFPLLILAELFPSAIPPLPIFPGLCITATANTFLIAGGSVPPTGAQLLLPPVGHAYSFAVPPGLAGFTVASQGVVLTATAANAIFASSTAQDLVMP